MKKLLSLILVTVMLFAVTAPVSSAADGYEKLPVIYIRGNGETIYNADGEVIEDFDLASLGGEGEDAVTRDKIVETCANILLPFLTEGLIMDKWDNYGKAIYEELAPLFKDSALDENGEASNGSGVSPSRLASSEAASNRDTKNYNLYDYSFCYDWRLSPYDHVERLHTYVENVMDATQKDQVCIVARCFGGSLLMAYLEQYGHLGHVKNAVFSDVLSNGTTVISKSFSGKIDFESDDVQRYLAQLDYCAQLDVGVGFSITGLVGDIVFKTVDLFNQVGIVDDALGGIENLYEKLYKALIPAVCFASGIVTQPNYWTCVYEEDFDEAINLIFGEKDSELYTKYSGLIKKITDYRERVTQKLPTLYKTFESYGIHIGTIGKYGYLNAPFTEGVNEPSDALVSLQDSTFGATCADVGETLTESQLEGKDPKYISPDKMVDVSTCVFPETTWVIKNAHHDFFGEFEGIILDFCRNTNWTVNSEGAAPQFIVFDENNRKWEKMTEENSADYDWISLPTEKPTTESRLVSFMRWLTTIFETIVAFLKGTFSLELGI